MRSANAARRCSRWATVTFPSKDSTLLSGMDAFQRQAEERAIRRRAWCRTSGVKILLAVFLLLPLAAGVATTTHTLPSQLTAFLTAAPPTFGAPTPKTVTHSVGAPQRTMLIPANAIPTTTTSTLPAPTPTTTTTSPPASTPPAYSAPAPPPIPITATPSGSSATGGDQAQWSMVATCEEGGNNDANYGYYGIIEWQGFDGYPNAGSAPMSVQQDWGYHYNGGPPSWPGEPSCAQYHGW